jgi:ApbE superfamily uncharacterized protein (UPF0280 family)
MGHIESTWTHTNRKTKDGGRFKERTYRELVLAQWPPTRITVQETDLAIYAGMQADVQLFQVAREAVLKYRGFIENYIGSHPDFLHTLHPWPEDPLSPGIVQEMIHAGRAAGVGPMAAVAGAIASLVGSDLLQHTGEIIVENGGDVFIQTRRSLTVSVFAGDSPLSLKIGIELPVVDGPMGVCTSSGTVGHSLSMGKADAVCIISRSCPLADAAATAVCNRIKQVGDIQPAIDWGRQIKGIDGILVIMGEKVGAWGQVKIVPLEKKVVF